MYMWSWSADEWHLWQPIQPLNRIPFCSELHFNVSFIQVARLLLIISHPHLTRPAYMWKGDWNNRWITGVHVNQMWGGSSGITFNSQASLLYIWLMKSNDFKTFFNDLFKLFKLLLIQIIFLYSIWLKGYANSQKKKSSKNFTNNESSIQETTETITTK